MTDRPLTTGEGNTAGRIVAEGDVHKVEPTRQYFAELRASLKNALDVQRDVEAECGRLREQVSELPSPEAFEYLTQLRERHIAQITALEKKCGRLREQLDAARLALEERIAVLRNRAVGAEARVSALTEQLDAARQLVDAAKPGLLIPPADCTNNCMDGPCDCSGKRRVTAWAVDVPALRAALGVEGPQPDQGSAPTENVGRARDEEPS